MSDRPLGLQKPTRGTAKRERRARTKDRQKTERSAMAEVRNRDKPCRFPLCRCRGRGLSACHSKHRGMGGNPAGDRTDPALMVGVCPERHRESKISLDRGTLRWEATTDAGAEGPIRWFVGSGLLFVPYGSAGLVRGDWIEIASEASRGVYYPLTENQFAIVQAINNLDS